MLETPIRTVGLAALLGASTGCIEYTLYDVTIETLLVDEAGEPVRERAYLLCPEFVFANGDVHVEACEDGFTDRHGIGFVDVMFQDLKTVTEVRATVEVEDTAAPGGVTSFETTPGDPALGVHVESTFSIPRAVLPPQVTRFSLVGIVTGGRDAHITDATGTLFIDIELPDGLGTFHGSAPVTTDDAAIYSAEVDVVSHYRFPLITDTIHATIDIDGFRGPGFLERLRVEGDEPRLVSGWGTF